jgi:hypothetical protein
MNDAMTAIVQSDGNLVGLDLDSEEWHDVPAFSTDIAAAWQVVEHMRLLDADTWLQFWRATDGHGALVGMTGPDAALAICRAALQVVSH